MTGLPDFFVNKADWGRICAAAEHHPRHLGLLDVAPGSKAMPGIENSTEFIEECVVFSKSGRELGWINVVVGKDKEVYRHRVVTVEKRKNGYRIGIRV